MPKYGLLVNYELCTGCHVCEIACKKEHQRPDDEWGIRVREVEPGISGDKQVFFPFPTENCNLCGKRVARGLQPACVKHCWAGVMKFGTIEELAEYMKQNSRTVIWAPH